MVVGQPFHVVVQGVQPGGRQQPGLAPAPAQPLALHPGPGDVLRAGDQHRAHRGAQPLGQAHAHGLEELAVVAQRGAGGHVGIPQPRAVQVHR